MKQMTLINPVTKEKLPVIFKEGKPKAVILDIEDFRLILALLGKVKNEDVEEAKILARSPAFRQLVETGISEIKMGKTYFWKDALEHV